MDILIIGLVTSVIIVLAVIIATILYVFLFDEDAHINDLFRDAGVNTKLASKKTVGKWQDRRDRDK